MKKFTSLLFATVLVSTLFANNLQIISLSTAGNNSANKTVLIKFDIGWENSWRTTFAPTNWDAAWVFIKYKNPVTFEWQHATLSTAASDHIAGGASTVKPSPDGVGAMIYRSTEGSGTVNFTGTQLMWRYGADGLSSPATDITVMGIEMVYAPEGSFYIGDGNGTLYSAQHAFYGGTSSVKTPVQITGGISPVIYNSLGSTAFRVSGSGGMDFNNDGVIDNAAFPTGYKAIYSMKYEITRGMYASFLKMLTPGQRSNRVDRTVKHAGFFTPEFDAIAQDKAMDALSYEDMCAYSDWSGLRLMTELEYEKIARGYAYPAYLDIAPGAISQGVFSTGLVNNGTSTEASAGPTDANLYLNNAANGACRVGLFATSTSNRVQSGASYFGIMNLSDNVSEIVVAAVDFNGWTSVANYQGTHGNGSISVSGFANVTDWPTAANSYTNIRGGNYQNNAVTYNIGDCSISYRGLIGGPNATARNLGWAGRSVRSDW